MKRLSDVGKMVTNLPEKAKAQWVRVSMAKDSEDKLRELQVFYSLVPKHKGTEKLLKQVKRKMASLRVEIRERKSRPKAVHYISKWSIPSHGVGRISLLGFAQESLRVLFSFLTERVIEAPVVYEPHFGMLDGGHVQFQVALLPPIGKSLSLDERVFSFCKNSHLILHVSNGMDFEELAELGRSHGFLPTQPEGQVEMKRLTTGGIRVVGQIEDVTTRDLVNLLNEYKIRNAIVKLEGQVTLGDVENEILGVWKYIPTLTTSLRGEEMIIEEHKETLSRHYFSSKDEVAEFFLRKLSLIRVFTKPPGEAAAQKPIVLKEGSTAGDLAMDVHSDLARRFKYALLWRGSMSSPLRISQNYRLEDKDLVEVRA